MTSSFQTVVGKSRDDIPDLPTDNYERTEADLASAANDAIDNQTQRSAAAYQQMAQIQKDIADRPLNLLQDIAQFSSQASQALQVFEDRKEAQKKIDEAMRYLDSNSSAQLRDAEGKFAFEDAKFNSELLQDGEIGENFLRVKTAPQPQDISLEQLISDIKTDYYGARLQIINENGGKDITDIQEYIELHNAADELVVTAMIQNARDAGIDVESRAFRKAFYEDIYPDLVQRRNNNVQSFKREANANYIKNRNIKLNKTILNGLKPLQYGKKVDIDAQQLVDTIYLEHGGDGNKNFTRADALEYLMTAVAADIVGENGVPTLGIHHLEYLYDQAQFVPSYAPGTRTTIEDSKFAQRDGYNKLIQDTKTKLAEDVERTRLAELRLEQQEIDELKKKYIDQGGIPPEILKPRIEDAKRRGLDVSKINYGSDGTSTNGGNSRVGVANPEGLEIEEGLQKFHPNYTQGEKLGTLEKLEVKKAYDEFDRRMGNQLKEGIDYDKAISLVLPQIQKELAAGDFALGTIEKQEGGTPSVKDIQDDNNIVKANVAKTTNQGNFVSLWEKQAIGQYKKHLIYGDPFPNYFNKVANGTKMSPKQYAHARLEATGGLNEDGTIKIRPRVVQDGYITNDAGEQVPNMVMVDPQYDLTLKDRNTLEVKPHLTKNLDFISDPSGENTKKLLNALKISNVKEGFYQPAFGFSRKNGNKLTVNQILTLANRGGSKFGIYHLTATELNDALKDGVIDGDALFNEDTQSKIVVELMRQRANRTNTIRGAIIQAKKGGTETVFEGDESEKRWDRLVSLSNAEQEVVLNAFPALRNIPMNQFQNLLGGVVLAIADGVIDKDIEDRKRREREEETRRQTEGIIATP